MQDRDRRGEKGKSFRGYTLTHYCSSDTDSPACRKRESEGEERKREVLTIEKVVDGTHRTGTTTFRRRQEGYGDLRMW